DIPLREVWICDGTDAHWYVDQVYRDVAEFNGAFDEPEPTATQEKIRAIWAALEGKLQSSKRLRDADVRSFPTAGTIHESHDAAYEVYVDGNEPTREFKRDDEMWVVFVAERSFLIRQIATHAYRHRHNKKRRREFMITASASIAEA